MRRKKEERESLSLLLAVLEHIVKFTHESTHGHGLCTGGFFRLLSLLHKGDALFSGL